MNSTNRIVKRFSAVGPTSTRIKKVASEQVVLYLRALLVALASSRLRVGPVLSMCACLAQVPLHDRVSRSIRSTRVPVSSLTVAMSVGCPVAVSVSR